LWIVWALWVVVSFSEFFEAITTEHIAITTLLKAYHRGLCEIYSISWGYHLGFYCEKNHVKGLSLWLIWTLLHSGRLHRGLFFIKWNLIGAYHRGLLRLYCIRWSYHRGCLCDNNSLKGLSTWVMANLLCSWRLLPWYYFIQFPLQCLSP
jgi:hypothetical protein